MTDEQTEQEPEEADEYLTEAQRVLAPFAQKPEGVYSQEFNDLIEYLATIDRTQDQNTDEVSFFKTKVERQKHELEYVKAVMVRPAQMTLSPKDKGAVLFTIVMMLMLPWVIARAVFTPHIPAAQIHVAAPAVAISGQELAESLMTHRLDFDSRTGLYMPLPPAAGDASVFSAACVDVCRAEARWPSTRPLRPGEEAPPPPRVLVNDPTHQICTCFTGGSVRRFVGWERR